MRREERNSWRHSLVALQPRSLVRGTRVKPKLVGSQLPPNRLSNNKLKHLCTKNAELNKDNLTIMVGLLPPELLHLIAQKCPCRESQIRQLATYYNVRTGPLDLIPLIF